MTEEEELNEEVAFDVDMLYAMADLDADGYLSPEEIRIFYIEETGYNMTNEEIAYVFEVLDTDKDNLISWDESYYYVVAEENPISLMSKKEKTELIFKTFDLN